jgi:allose kinase
VPDPLLVIDIGGTWTRVGHLGDDGAPAPMRRISSDGLRSRDPVGFLVREVRSYEGEAGITPSALVVGVPFTPDPDLETALSSPNIRELEGLPLRRRLEEELGRPVLLERDINLLALGEWWTGAARGAAATFAMFVGTGVGACYLEQGRPFRGATGSAVELGHVPIRGEGRRCVCGNTDCLEAYACGHVLNELAKRHARPVTRLFVDAHVAPEPLKDALDLFVRDLAFALATAVNLFQPEVALVGGGVPEMDAFPRDRFGAVFHAHLRKPVPAETVRLAWAELGSEAALHGAPLRAAVLERTNP